LQQFVILSLINILENTIHKKYPNIIHEKIDEVDDK